MGAAERINAVRGAELAARAADRVDECVAQMNALVEAGRRVDEKLKEIAERSDRHFQVMADKVEALEDQVWAESCRTNRLLGVVPRGPGWWARLMWLVRG